MELLLELLPRRDESRRQSSVPTERGSGQRQREEPNLHVLGNCYHAELSSVSADVFYHAGDVAAAEFGEFRYLDLRRRW